jgi:TPR repeat protein
MRRVNGLVLALALSGVSIGGSLAQESFQTVARVAQTTDSSVAALRKAAEEGNLRAMVHMAELLTSGTLVAQDRLKACQMYGVIVDRFATVDRYDPTAALVARAFRGTAECYAEGLGAPGWQRNMNAAADLWYHAGVILQDPESLFALGRLYLAGEGVPYNAAMAIRFLEGAARKQFAPAQAVLGSMMWEGKVMKRNAASGLALLILGKERTSPDDRAWIASLYDDAMITASKDVEREALDLVDKWKSVHGNQTGNTLETVATVPAPAKSPTRELKGLDLDISNGTDSYSNQTTRANTDLPPAATTAPEGR